MKMEQTECSETSAYKIQTSGNYPEGSIKHSEQGEKSEIKNSVDYRRICKQEHYNTSQMLFTHNLHHIPHWFHR